MTDSGPWRPEVKRWVGQEAVSIVVLVKLGAMRREFPSDLGVAQAAREAARQFIGDAPGDDRGARLEIVVDALRLEVGPGSTKQLTAAEFLKRP